METRDIVDSVGNVIGELSLPDNTPEDTWTAKLLEYSQDNIRWVPAPIPPQEVITQFEKNIYTLKLASCSAVVGSDGTSTALLRIPGTAGTNEGRWISSGEGFFDMATAGDKIIGVWFVDHDNILGYGVDFVVGSYTDDQAGDDGGWFFPPIRGTLKAESIGFYGFAPSGLYIKVVGKKGGGLTTGTLYVNFEWAIKIT